MLRCSHRPPGTGALEATVGRTLRCDVSTAVVLRPPLTTSLERPADTVALAVLRLARRDLGDRRILPVMVTPPNDDCWAHGRGRCPDMADGVLWEG